MLSTMKSIILIALVAMLTIANAEAHPSPKSFESLNKKCDWDWPHSQVRVVIVLLKSVVKS